MLPSECGKDMLVNGLTWTALKVSFLCVRQNRVRDIYHLVDNLAVKTCNVTV